jgi:hypothetical protein
MKVRLIRPKFDSDQRQKTSILPAFYAGQL